MLCGIRLARLCLSLGLLLGVAACHEKTPVASAPPPANVDVIDVALRDVPVVFDYVAQTESSQQVEIRARVNGFLEKRVYQEGALVHQGDVMFVMDRKPFEAALDAARAEYAQQKARLDTAQANLNRVRPLVAKNALSQKDLDDSVGQQQAAAAALEQARANVTSASLNLGYTTITAPVTGLSSFAKKQDGSYIDATNSLLTYVAKLDPMWINFSLSENEMLDLRTQINSGALKFPQLGKLEAVIVLADGSVYPYRGRIAFTDASLSTETGTYLIRAEVPNPTGALRPGQFVRIKLLGADRASAVAVPQDAVMQGPRGAYVWTVDKDGKAQQRSVETGEWNGNDWVIRSGLHAGDRVVVDNTLRLMPGAVVKANVVATPPASVKIPGADTANVQVANPDESAKQAAPQNGASASSAKSAAPATSTEANAAALTRLYFEVGSASLDAQSASALAAVAQRLVSAPDTHVVISGYTDSSGSYAANERLAASRAATVRAALIVAGVQNARIDMRKPARIVATDPPDKSRRVDVTLSPTAGG
ncbi:efflux RND transporter periplasmic adaptor subunit [Paraburkholderia tropica]|uniref:efflux RND transporter periplasmic adaptor subunit n=1 Tax=Paraburkholderia tropica TaxID=92647 RepID=UPI0007EC47FF|nr:efflux RND transporter periplasmic adaptor subunit [Paraburkholderia tropica]MBB2981695.1 membrane fusion protein (multidrug efflux system) [Paraburkholderia tropica]OBR46374.1 efflux transporter periplasmic adaptor subunit [Paraburkholderia tropica]